MSTEVPVRVFWSTGETVLSLEATTPLAWMRQAAEAKLESERGLRVNVTAVKYYPSWAEKGEKT